jgi:glycosyltransferase involved in cell wall biosynthesis
MQNHTPTRTKSANDAHRNGNRVLLVSPSRVATFIYQDLGFLQSRFDAELFQYEGVRSLVVLREKIAGADAVVIWFAGEHAAPAVWFARQAGIPVATIIGGYDGAWVPDIAYGVRPGSYNACRVRWILRKSDRIFAVSHDIKSGVQRLADDVTANIRIMYNAVNTDYFRPDESKQRVGVLCVGNIHATTIERKGWRLFADAAAAMPHVPFCAVGPARDEAAQYFVNDAPSNLTWHGELTGEPLVLQFQAASVYFQGSRHEGFGVVVAEAMACGCIPVVTRAGALPEVVGDSGFYMTNFQADSAVTAIRAALEASDERRHSIRRRVVDLFGIEQRRHNLCTEIQSMIENTSTTRD